MFWLFHYIFQYSESYWSATTITLHLSSLLLLLKNTCLTRKPYGRVVAVCFTGSKNNLLLDLEKLECELFQPDK